MDNSLFAVLPILMVPLAVAGWLAMWCGVIFLLSWVGGWNQMAQRFRTTRPSPPGTRLSSGRIGWVNYNNTLYVGTTPEGLHLSVMIFFRIAHPALLIPWSALTYQGEALSLWVKRIRIQVHNGPVLTIPADRVRYTDDGLLGPL